MAGFEASRLRRPAGLILPLLAVMSLFAVGCAAFGSITVTFNSDEDQEDDYYHLYEFHDEGVREVVNQEGLHYDGNGTILYEQEPYVWNTYDAVSARNFLDLDTMEVLSKDVDSTSGRAGFLAILVVIGLLAHLRKPFDEEESDFSGWTFTTVLGLVALASISAAWGVLSDFGDGVESAVEDGSGAFEIEATISGSADELISGNDWLIVWSPGGVFWFNLIAGLLLVFAAVLHAPPLVRQMEKDMKGERVNLLPSFFKPPEVVAKQAPFALVGLLGVLLLGALILPWITLEQHIYVIEEDEEVASEHVFAWSVTQWQVWQTNNSLFEVEDPDDAQSSSEFGSHRGYPRLDSVTSDVSSMRWPGVTALVIFLIAAPLSLSAGLRSKAGGESNGWKVLLLVGLFMTMGLGTSGFEEDIGDSMFADAHRATGDQLARFFWSGGDAGAYSSMQGSINVVANETSLVEAVWQPGLAATSAGLLSMLTLLCLLDLAVTAVRTPKIQDAFTTRRFDGVFNTAEWIAKPTIVAVVIITLFAMLGSGIGNLVLHPSFDSPEDLDQYTVITSYDSFINETEFTTMSDGDTIELTVNASELGFQHVLIIELSISCEEGGTSLVADEEDTFDVEIIPPSDVDFSDLSPLTYTLTPSDCSWWGAQRQFENQRMEPVAGDYWAKNEEDAINNSGVDFSSGEPWTVRLTAHVNSGLAPPDPNANAKIEMTTTGYTVSAEN